MDIIDISKGEGILPPVFSKLSEPQLRHYYEPDEGIFIAESPLVIGRALDAGYEPLIFLASREDISGQAAGVIARCGDIPVYTGDEEDVVDITGFRLVRGALCAFRRMKLPGYREVLSVSSRLAVLEDVVNPTNIGAIIRSAAALGMDAVLLTEKCGDPLYRRASRVSMGTVFQIPWAYLPDSEILFPELLREEGFASAAMALTDDSVSIDDEKLSSEKKLAVVLGTEGEGLRSETISACDYTVKIPMFHGVDSLNVAAASAVAFWQLRSRKE